MVELGATTVDGTVASIGPGGIEIEAEHQAFVDVAALQSYRGELKS